MVEKNIQEFETIRKKIYLNIAKWYSFVGMGMIAIGIAAAAGDTLGFWQTRTSLVVSTTLGFITILGGILLLHAVLFVIFGISRRRQKS